MRPHLFISDLHLHQTRPETSAAFFHFLSSDATRAEALYILGDLFEYWVGDDQLDHDILSREVCDAIRTVSNAGVEVFFMHGNRDFLIGDRFATEANLTILTDPAHIRLGGRSLLLLHGDTLCTDDIAYQQFRRQARDPAWQAGILAKPYGERVALAASIRERSDTEKATKAADIMDVSLATVEQVFRTNGYIDMIHGHTHRPATHVHMVDGHRCTRQVLADWHTSAKWLSDNDVGK
ncbi:MAG: UDP-2,3-diacylglucosamine diphosphatase [Betaproteobacteria bacterium]|jgi:UDP-2,3-diacylglucosamine hydrolase